MMNVMDLVDRYVAVWNEPNADERRKRIRSLWAPDGTTCYRLLDAHGYEAIEARVTSSWDKFPDKRIYFFIWFVAGIIGSALIFSRIKWLNRVVREKTGEA